MLATLMVVLPIFALIMVGFGARRLNVLGPHAMRELNRFVVYLALPALLFDVMAHTGWQAIYQPGFITAFGISSGVVFLLTVLLQRCRYRQPLADASIDGLNAAYGNTGYIGIPLCLVAFGKDSLVMATIAAIMTVCLLFAVAIILIELGLQTERHKARLILKVGRSLAKNPLLIAPLLGAGWSALGLTMPQGIETFFKLLGGAATPCALAALGLFLAEKRSGAVSNRRDVITLVVLKLLLAPALAWAVAVPLLGLPPLIANAAVVLSALPTGTGPFMLAEYYRRDAGTTSTTILVSTLLSVLTVSGYLAWIA